MQRLRFYMKLATGNLWRNRGAYIPYLLACVISIFTFYTMLSISVNGSLDGIRGESVVKSFSSIGVIVIGIFCSVLVFYTNSFLIKRRKKELGLYAILGMEKRNIGVLMLFESLIISAIALAAGLALGMLLSRLLFWVMLRLTHYPVMLDMPVSAEAIAYTALLFGIVFLLALVFNLFQVRLTNPIELLSGARQGEKEPKASWLLTIIGIASLLGGYFVALHYSTVLESIIYFFPAALLVIIGTYCLFTSGSIAFLKLLRRNKRYYYQPNHFITVSGMIYRMKQNAAGLASICILSCMVLVAVSSAVSMNLVVEDTLKVQYPYEYDLRFYAPGDGDTLLAGAETAAQESGAQIAGLRDYRKIDLAMEEKTAGNFSVFYNSPDMTNEPALTYLRLYPLSDYNRNENASVSLEAGQALLFVTGGYFDEPQITVEGRAYAYDTLDSFGRVEANSRDISRTIALIIPDGDWETIGDFSTSRNITFDLEGEEAAKALFQSEYVAYTDSIRTEETFNMRIREDGRQDWYATNGGFLFLGLYCGILFMLAAALIIYYKQMSEGYDDVGRFEILQKVGMSADEVRKAINGQILTVFFLPLVVAVLHIAVAFFPLSRIMVLFGVLNLPYLALATAATVLAYALVYFLVFRRTAKTYFRIVRREGSALLY